MSATDSALGSAGAGEGEGEGLGRGEGAGAGAGAGFELLPLPSSKSNPNVTSHAIGLALTRALFAVVCNGGGQVEGPVHKMHGHLDSHGSEAAILD